MAAPNSPNTAPLSIVSMGTHFKQLLQSCRDYMLSNNLCAQSSLGEKRNAESEKLTDNPEA